MPSPLKYPPTNTHTQSQAHTTTPAEWGSGDAEVSYFLQTSCREVTSCTVVFLCLLIQPTPTWSLPTRPRQSLLTACLLHDSISVVYFSFYYFVSCLYRLWKSSTCYKELSICCAGGVRAANFNEGNTWAAVVLMDGASSEGVAVCVYMWLWLSSCVKSRCFDITAGYHLSLSLSLISGLLVCFCHHKLLVWSTCFYLLKTCCAFIDSSSLIKILKADVSLIEIVLTDL